MTAPADNAPAGNVPADNTVASRFRPWLDHWGPGPFAPDDPGPWSGWTLDAAERAAFATVLAEGGAVA
ncbi:MAG TPA: hypothetical protein VIR45_09415, partial [Kiloniellaceae bacterium]